MNGKQASIRRMALFPVITVVMIVLYGCNRKHRDTYEIRHGLFIETFSAGLIGNLSAQYLTDSVNFRIYVGTYDDETESLYYTFKGDSVYVEKVLRIDDTSLMKTVDKKN